MASDSTAKTCAKCGSDKIVSGNEGVLRGFQPDGFNYWRFTTAKGIMAKSFACRECGMVWRAVNPTELKEFIEKYCS